MAQRQRNGKGNSNNGNEGDDGNNGNEDDGNRWRDGDGRRDGNTTAMAAIGGATAHNWWPRASLSSLDNARGGDVVVSMVGCLVEFVKEYCNQENIGVLGVLLLIVP